MLFRSADLICLRDEKLDFSKPLEIFNPIHTWKKKKLTNYYAKELMIQIFNKGECCYESPSVKEIQGFVKNETEKLWEEVLRFENPHTYYVDLSRDLWTLKHDLLDKFSSLYE